MECPAVQQPPRTIYFAQGTITLNIKIGIADTIKIETRLKTIAAHSSDPVVCLKTMPGTTADEQELHRRFRDAWSHGEWYKPTDDLLEYIASLPCTEYTGHRPTIHNFQYGPKPGAKLSERQIALRERYLNRPRLTRNSRTRRKEARYRQDLESMSLSRV
jgi:hypothetical protein